MRAIYERTREEDNRLCINLHQDHSFYPHFHANAELLISGGSKYRIMLNDKSFVATGSYVVFCDSYDVHGFELIEHGSGKDYVIIIPPYQMKQYRKFTDNKRIKDNCLYDKALADRFASLINDFLPDIENSFVNFAFSQTILSLIAKSAAYSEFEHLGDGALIVKLMQYINNNFTDHITLGSISSALGYRQEHLSRVFHQYARTNIREYINRQRLNYISKRLEEDKNANITDLIFESGFTSVQSYYRAKKKLPDFSDFFSPSGPKGGTAAGSPAKTDGNLRGNKRKK